MNDNEILLFEKGIICSFLNYVVLICIECYMKNVSPLPLPFLECITCNLICL